MTIPATGRQQSERDTATYYSQDEQIEALRRELNNALEASGVAESNRLKVEAENERLRAALERISENGHDCLTPEQYSDDKTNCPVCIARAGLAAPSPEADAL